MFLLKGGRMEGRKKDMEKGRKVEEEKMKCGQRTERGKEERGS